MSKNVYVYIHKILKRESPEAVQSNAHSRNHP
jgi:hypothetical protein